MTKWCYTAIVSVGCLFVMTSSSARAGGLPAATEEALRESGLIYVATERRNGERSKASPIWFFYDDGKIFFTTSPGSWKAKRIARGSPVHINVGSADGPFLAGKAERVTDPELVDRMGAAYADKYWIAWLGFFKPRSARVSSGKTMAYLVTPAEDPPTR